MSFAANTKRYGIPPSALWLTPTSKRLDYIYLVDSPIGFYGTPQVTFKQSRGSVQVAASDISMGMGDGSVQSVAETFLLNPDMTPAVGLYFRFVPVTAPVRTFVDGVTANVWMPWTSDIVIANNPSGASSLKAATLQISSDMTNILRSISIDLQSERTDD